MAFASEKGRQGAAGVSTGYDIDNSLRFNDNDSAYLSWTPTTASNRKTWTWSGWVKRGNIGTDQHILNTYTGTGAVNTSFFFEGDALKFYDYEGGGGPGYQFNLKTSRLFRDASAWYHIVVQLDTTQATASDRAKIYINGTQETSFSTADYPTLNYNDGHINTAVEHQIGTHDGGAYLDGYLAEVHFIDGQSFFSDTSGTASTTFNIDSFGETGDYGEWKAKKVSGLTYGTNGFYLNFVGNNVAELTTFTDSSSSALTVTSRGAATHDGTYAKFGQSSLKLDGTNGYQGYCGGYNGTYEFPISSSVGPNGSNSITFDCWIYQTSFLNTLLFFAIACDWYSPNFSIGSTGLITYGNQSNGGSNNSSVTASTAITLNAWNHIACTIQNKTVKLWLNGTQVGSKTWTTGTWSNSGSKIIIGANGGGWLDEVRVSNTIRYGSTFTPETSAYTADGNTTFLMHSDVSTSLVGTLGADNSGKSNHWTTNNLASTDQMVDTPTNNFATWNPLDQRGSSNTFSQGNLQVLGYYQNSNDSQGATMAVSSGKWYWETYIKSATNVGGYHYVGIKDPTNYDSNYWIVRGIGEGTHNGTGITISTASWAVGDIVGCALDMDTGNWYIYVNGSIINSGNAVYTGINVEVTPTQASASGANTQTTVANFGQDSSFAGNKTAQGNQDSNSIGDFYYTPPSGFLALCTKNLPDPAVIPSEHFNTKLFTGDGSSNRSITGTGFTPDFNWLKLRSAADNHVITDVMRGTNHLHTNTTSSDSDLSYPEIIADGFKVSGGTYNNNLGTFVAWQWKANGAGVPNTSGSINSTVSANADAGFSIVSYTGNSTAGATIGHGLSSVPEMIIQKNRNNTNYWNVYLHEWGGSYNMYLNTTSALSTPDPVWWNGTDATNTVFSVGSDRTSNWSSDTYIAYCFHSVDGYSKVGTYTGNGSTDGTFVYTGFKPAYVMVKASNTSSEWLVWDGARNEYNVVNSFLYPNANYTEYTGTAAELDFTSNGFKLRNTNTGTSKSNALNDTYIYIAFAESPFKHTNAR
jgi:hypothetical protein